MSSHSNPLLTLICVALLLAELLLLARVIVSWIEYFGGRRPMTGTLRSAYDLLIGVTDVGLRPLRRIVPPVGMFDISVLVAFVIIFVLRLAVC